MDSFNDFYLLRSVVLSLSLWHTKTPHFLNSIPYCLTNGGQFTQVQRLFYIDSRFRTLRGQFRQLRTALRRRSPGSLLLLVDGLHRGDTFRNRLTMLRDASQSRFHLRSRYSQSFVIRRHSRSFAVNLLSLEEFCCQTKRSVRALL